jgi:sporulation protein YlmC with PRC-barrel domain
MKKLIKMTLPAALTIFAIAASAAGNSSQQSSQQDSQQSQYSSNSNTNRQQRLSKDCSINKILNAEAKSKDGQDLGTIDDVLLNPKTGKVDFVVLGKGGVLGMGEDRIPVPWQAVTAQPNGNGSVVINKTKSELNSAPRLKKDNSNMDEPYTVTIYEFYAVPVPAGGAESASGQSQGSGSSTNSNAAQQTSQ